MTELPGSYAQDELRELEGSDGNALVTGRRTAMSTRLEHVGAACRSLVFFGTCAGWCLAILGAMVGVEHILDSAAVPSPTPARLGSAVLGGLSLLVSFCLAGWGVAVVTRIATSLIREWLEHATRASEVQFIGLSQVVAQLERLVESLGKPAGHALLSQDPASERAHSIAEIARAIRAANWIDAQIRLDELETSYPNDPELSAMREQFARARHDAVQTTLSQLSAAREVNDPDRVLEIYQLVQSSLDETARAALEQDVAKWFLSLIHRRLRLGKVEPDVVHLASRFAETFASTVEGASVRASLSTLRRSVGLCPRCAQPYTGIADACPKCLKPPLNSSAPFSGEAGTNEHQ
jgi:hypothetical protein